MATNQKQERNLSERPGRIDADFIRTLKDQPLPCDMLSDLRDSFEFFAKGGQYVNRTDLDSILYNFGFRFIREFEQDKELKAVDKDYKSATGFDFDFI